MVSLRALALAVLAGVTLASPLDKSEIQNLVPRQSTTWNDPYIKKPYAFAAQAVGNCNYQITFRRDGFDSRHTIRFYATYPGSSTRREITPVTRSWTTSRTGIADYGLYTVPNGNNYVISVHRFTGICASGSSGSAPSSLFVRSTLGDGYTYRNDFISPAITPVTATLPLPPTNLRVVKVAGTTGNYTASWSPSSSATGGYYALIRIRVYASELGGFVPGTRTMVTSPGQTSVTFKIYSRDELDSVAVSSQAATDVVSDPTIIPIVAPSA
ncbi:hypothetical protein OC846_004641 [Tilletia horrida]|uniref:Fibronectin type-III domain-containing protein n=1 Tax=Tilletia horrida TaxID=155126 RepID=A0AAN6GPD3_9BASI|nr:hypothetical protein OC845_004817 [Tilletia horrida]KAK0548013.1 hypothetical protein OC846_004641 [Tilletia horrida]